MRRTCLLRPAAASRPPKAWKRWGSKRRPVKNRLNSTPNSSPELELAASELCSHFAPTTQRGRAPGSPSGAHRGPLEAAEPTHAPGARKCRLGRPAGKYHHSAWLGPAALGRPPAALAGRLNLASIDTSPQQPAIILFHQVYRPALILPALAVATNYQSD